ncbi:uncharacterized protein LOC132754533 [Ruditapes philippinarum]|uniref:uncharacterized protein LOC132754533 n=1 Tax=Ruditapes philippinarum TaxID=129788 RepID=UPI00295B9523|nr:uncharacterized protein LOC132754533 [Ruditapes philippinarum]
MATSRLRQRRQEIMSAPPMSRLPRLDSFQLQRELTLPGRRQGTAKIRQEFFDSRRDDFVQETSKKAEIERLKQYRRFLDSMKLLRKNSVKHNQPVTENSEWAREITKIDLPERLPITVPIRLKSAQPIPPRHGHLPNTNPIFYRVRLSSSADENETCTLFTGDNKSPVKQKPQYFISQDWSSEKASWFNLHHRVPEFQKTNWICC